MGKAALLVVLAASLGGSLIYVSQNRTAFESASTEAGHDERILARLAAESGWEVVLSRAKADFANYRGSWTMDTADGFFTITASGPASGPVSIASSGTVNGNTFYISADLEMSSGVSLDAVTFDGTVKKFKTKNSVTLSGLDTNPDGSEGAGPDVHAILMTDSDSEETVTDELSSGDAPGIGGSPDVIVGSPGVDLGALSAAVLAYSGSARIDYSGDTKFKETTIGSAGSPKVVIVDGDVTLEKEFVGYGVLYVGGEFEAKDDGRWEGLVIVERNGGKHKMDKDSAIYGSLIIRTVSEQAEDGGDIPGDQGLPGGHFDIDVYDEPDATDELYHEHKYDDDYNVTGVDLLSPTGCKTNGGLCWNQIMTGEGAVFVEFLNPVRGWGTYSIQADAATYSGKTVPAVNAFGRVEDDLPNNFLMAADQIDDFSINFEYLCALTISSPGDSIHDPVDRNGAFAVRIYRANSVGATWQKGDLVYELGVYHHTGYGMWVDKGGTVCDPSAGFGGGTVSVAAGEEMEIEFKKDSMVQYSSLALSRLYDLFPILDTGSDAFSLTNLTSGFGQ